MKHMFAANNQGGLHMDCVEVTPVEIDTSVTNLPRGRGQLLGWNWDRVWSVKQEAHVL
jgi:hypothetical protein